jgi:hypothetical protein
MSKESNRPVRQELMLDLIYPAVLGTILYQLVFHYRSRTKGTISPHGNSLDQMDVGCRFDWILRL